jgi:nitroimidazol reductase NimA-like FMN-containing flavoprotein (pyridoxamine 5'-phosphate oxidase superfamily)
MTVVCDPVRIQYLGADECRRLLATQQVGRLGFICDGQPDVLPVNYVLDGDAVVFATSPGSKLWAATRSTLAFEVDSIDPAGQSGWSVVIHGLAQEITGLDSTSVVERVGALPLAPWPGGDRPNRVRLPFTSITGRRVGI